MKKESIPPELDKKNIVHFQQFNTWIFTNKPPEEVKKIFTQRYKLPDHKESYPLLNSTSEKHLKKVTKPKKTKKVILKIGFIN